MWDNATITMLLEGTRDTLYMTLVIRTWPAAGNPPRSDRQRRYPPECCCL